MSANKAIEGGCLCGGVRYTIPKPLFTGICHCKDCQKQTSSAFSVVVGVPASQFVVTKGNPKEFCTIGTSGKSVHRLFCGDCGSAIVSHPDVDQTLSFVKEGTLDDTSSMQPQMHVFTRDKQPWLQLNDGLPAFHTSPPKADKK